jgi:hypothetical protein
VRALLDYNWYKSLDCPKEIDEDPAINKEVVEVAELRAITIRNTRMLLDSDIDVGIIYLNWSIFY